LKKVWCGSHSTLFAWDLSPGSMGFPKIHQANAQHNATGYASGSELLT
jgi:hypothetical protein